VEPICPCPGISGEDRAPAPIERLPEPLVSSLPDGNKMSFPGTPTSPRFLRRPEIIKEKAVGNLLDAGFAYSRSLSGHSSCVNSLAFSNGDGRFLASGGDDLQIQLFDFQTEDLEHPSLSLVGPTTNVFSLAFSANNTHLYCGTTGKRLYKYDLATFEKISGFPASPTEVFDDHSDTIRDLTCHPWQNELVMTASEDGKIILRDSRVEIRRSNAQTTFQNDCEFTGVRWNPQMDKLFATSDNHGTVCLRDTRTSFGSALDRTRQPLEQFVTSLSKPSHTALACPETSSIAWDREGSRLSVTMLNYYPTIYALNDPHPIAICKSTVLPDGIPIPDRERTYTNACTIKAHL